MRIAFSLLPDRFEDRRHEIFKAGLRAVGYTVVEGHANEAGTGDLILGWNAYGATYQAMRNAGKTSGVRALVFEEAYIRNINGEKYFAVAIGGHNGSGEWRIGGPERWASWNIPVKPWRKDGNQIVVCGQRGFGYNAMAMATDWPDKVAAQLRKITDRPLWFRPHPKRRAKMPSGGYDRVLDWNAPIAQHLDGAWAAVTWTSNAATDALLAGIPAIFEGPALVTQPASTKGLSNVVSPPLRDRQQGFVNMSWAQWSMSELKTGEAFAWLLASQ